MSSNLLTAIPKLIFFLYLSGFVFYSLPASEPEGPETPEWVKKRLTDLANGSKSYNNHRWPKVGVPAGLDEQLRKAWAPDAPQVWKNISPGFTNVITDAKIDNGVITVTLDIAGMMQSRDGGKSWRELSHHLPYGRQLSFDISPVNPNLIVLGSSYLVLTRNGGQSWNWVYNKNLPELSDTYKTPFNQVRFNADGSRLFTAHGRATTFSPITAQRLEQKEKLKEIIKRKLIYVADGDIKEIKKIDLGDFAACRCIVPHPKNPNLVFVTFSDGSVYRSNNASKAEPKFEKLILPKVFNGFQCFKLDISPANPNELLFVMVPSVLTRQNKSVSKLFRVKLNNNTVAKTEEIELNNPHGSIQDAKWNPRNPQQVFVGIEARPSIMYISNNNMKTFQTIPFPEKLKCGETSFYWSPCRFTFDRKSNLAMTRSLVGAWTSRNGFRSMTPLMMDYDPERKLYGNKGTGASECAESIVIRDKYTYIAITDHGAFRSNGKDISKWQRISWDRPGIPKVNGKPFRGQSCNLGVSEDEKFLYQILRKPYAKNNLKVMQSKDQGNTWVDITERLGKGKEISINQSVQQIIFDPTDSNKQWILFWDRLFYSLDGGKTFKEVKFDKKVLCSTGSNALAYDPAHKVLYLSQISRILKSTDYGATWIPLAISPCPNVGGIGVLDNGNLALGMMGALVVIPYNKIGTGKVKPEMVRMTIGENPEDFARGRFDFRGVCCEGQNIIVSTFNAAKSNIACKLGILMSTDGGKKFNWISHDIPFNGIGNIDMRDGRIVIGARTLYTTTIDKCLKKQ